MLFYQALLLFSTATAIPLSVTERQLDRTSLTENEFSKSLTCGDVIFVWARGTTELGNMGSIVGQPLGDALRREYGSGLQIEGVDYAALLSTNYLPGGTDLAAELKMRGILQDINRRCPNAAIVTGGYSQGAAVNHRAIEDLSSAVKDQIAGVVTFGDTQKKADNGRIPNFPQNKLKIFCAEPIHDTVCDGNLAGAILPPHLSYGDDADEAAEFLISKVSAVQAKKA